MAWLETKEYRDLKEAYTLGIPYNSTDDEMKIASLIHLYHDYTKIPMFSNNQTMMTWFEGRKQQFEDEVNRTRRLFNQKTRMLRLLASLERVERGKITIDYSDIIVHFSKTTFSDLFNDSIATDDLVGLFIKGNKFFSKIGNASYPDDIKLIQEFSLENVMLVITSRGVAYVYEDHLTFADLKNPDDNKAFYTILKQIFPFLNFSEMNITNITGRFIIPNIKLSFLLLFLMIKYDDVLSFYNFFVNELTVPVALRSIFKYYRLQNDASVSIKSFVISNGTKLAAFFPMIENEKQTDQDVEREVSFNKDTLSLEIIINSASNYEDLRKTVLITQLLITYYVHREVNYKDKFATLFPNLDDFIYPIEREEIKSRNILLVKKIDLLRRYDADHKVFIPNYPTYCQSSHQPIVLRYDEDKEEVENIKNQGRQVLHYPAVDPFYWFYCPNDTYRYPGVIKNGNPANNDIYPVVPCCFTADQMDENSPKKTTLEYYGKIKHKSHKNEKSYLIVTKKIIDKDRFAVVDLNFESFLKGGFNYPGKFYRYGIRQGPSSFIECLLKARNIAATDANIKKVRKTLFDQVDVSTIRQELANPDDIHQQDTYIKASDFYHAFEYFFGVNIFIFSRREDGTYDFVIPQYKQFYCRNYNIRPTVLINQVEISKNLFHNELIVFSYDETFVLPCDKPSRVIFLFDHYSDEIDYSDIDYSQFLGYYIYRQFNEIYNIFTYRITGNDQLKGYLNMFSIESLFKNWMGLELSYFTSQFIDEYGKVRAIVMKNDLVVETFPIQPMNLKHISFDDLNAIYPPKFDAILTILNEFPTSRYKDEGVWYAIGEEREAFFIRCTDINPDYKLPNGKEPYLTNEKNKDYEAYITSLTFYETLTKEAVELYRGSEMSPMEFVEKNPVMRKQPAHIKEYMVNYLKSQNINIDLKISHFNTHIVTKKDAIYYIESKRHVGEAIVLKEITPSTSEIFYPLVYRFETGKMYMIQNFPSGDKLSKAIYVSREWKRHKVNMGQNVSSGKNFKKGDYISYGISSNKQLAFIGTQEEYTVINMNLPEIIDYGLDEYGALLPL